MAAIIGEPEALAMYALGLITEDELRHYLALADWRKLLRAGANTTTPTPQEDDPCPKK